jgi:RimJ/RimL family protein N-acetyltransferase
MPDNNLPMTDGVVIIRPPEFGDGEILIAGRDEAFYRWIGPGAEKPEPVACIVASGEIVGWVDYDTGHPWLGVGEVNVGYYLFAAHRGNGYASRAVELLMQYMALSTDIVTATLLIDPQNDSSLELARRTGFSRRADVDGQCNFERPVRVVDQP